MKEQPIKTESVSTGHRTVKVKDCQEVRNW